MSGKMLAKSVLVTGANRGLGLVLVKKLAAKVDHVFAGCRKPSEAKELQELTDTHKNIVVLKLNVTDESDIASCVKEITTIVSGAGLSCLINNAGMKNDECNDHNLEDLTADKLNEVYQTNVTAPAMIAKAFLPLLRQAAQQQETPGYLLDKAVVVNMSSILGSLENNTKDSARISRMYGYRMSKVALTMLSKNMGFELEDEGIYTIAMHPGWVSTDMGGPEAPLTPDGSVEGMIEVISSLTKEKVGLCLDWKGETVAN